jgi:uncharacterized membrane protein
MNVYECNGKNILKKRKIEFCIQEATDEWNGKLNLSQNENIFTIARMKTFIICFKWLQNTENRTILSNL